jgi:hypothetical protein
VSTHTTRLAIGALLVIGARDAAADGETTPMLGAAVIAADTSTPEQEVVLAGVALDAAWWYGRLGLAAEGSARWSVDGDRSRELVAGASARLRVLEGLSPSLMDPRDVEVGCELQAIVERAWWNTPVTTDPVAYGGGIAIRIRGHGGGDPDMSTLLAESRFFLRVMASRTAVDTTTARTTMPTTTSERALTVVLGVGASWGGGTPSYASRFRLHPFGHTLIP